MSDPDTKGESDPNAGEGSDPNTQGEVERALREIRHEAYKVAVVYGVADAALVTLLTAAVLALLSPAWAEGSLTLAETDLPVRLLLSAGVGPAVLVTEVALRLRRPVVAQFEAANPAVREQLRTARDAVDDDEESRMARVLYGDVLASLRETSSIGLVDLKRLSLTLGVVVVLSVASIQVAVVDLDLGGDAQMTTGDSQDPSYDGLKGGDAVLGDSDDVSAGDEELEAELSGSGEGDAPPGGSASSYESSGLPSGDVESQRAGFTSSQRLEDAELIRDYTLGLQNETDV